MKKWLRGLTTILNNREPPELQILHSAADTVERDLTASLREFHRDLRSLGWEYAKTEVRKAVALRHAIEDGENIDYRRHSPAIQAHLTYLQHIPVCAGDLTGDMLLSHTPYRFR